MTNNLAPVYANVGLQESPYAIGPGIPGIDQMHGYARPNFDGKPLADPAAPGERRYHGLWHDSRAGSDSDLQEWQNRNASRQIEPKLVSVRTDPLQQPVTLTERTRDPRNAPIVPPRPTSTQGPRMYLYRRPKSPYGARMESNDGTHGSYAVPSKTTYGADTAQRARRALRQTRRETPTPFEAQITTPLDNQNYAQAPVLATGSSLSKWW